MRRVLSLVLVLGACGDGGGGAAGTGGGGAGGAGGQGGGGAPMNPPCGLPLLCPQQAAGEYCVTGRVAPLGGQTLPSSPCVSIHDPAAFLAGGRTPLGAQVGVDGNAEVAIDECGRFAIHRVPRTASGGLLALVQSCTGWPADWAPAAMPFVQGASPSIELVQSSRPSAITAGTVERWAQAAGRDLAPGGAAVVCFEGVSGPVSGVVPSAPGQDLSSATIYFGADPGTLDPTRPFAMGTGPTGCALVHPAPARVTGLGEGTTFTEGTPVPSDGVFTVVRLRAR